MTARAAAVQCLLVVFGYIAALLAAGTVMTAFLLSEVAVLVAPDLPDAPVAMIFPVVVPVLAAFLGNLSFYPFLPIALASEMFGWRSWLVYALAAGALAVFIGLDLLGTSPADLPPWDAYFLVVGLGAGMVGGVAYWLVAGRTAGDWRRAREVGR